MKYRFLVCLCIATACVCFIDVSLATDEDTDPLTTHSHAIMTPSELTQKELEELKKQADLEDFEIIPRGESNPLGPTTQNLNPPEIDEEVKEILTQGGSSLASGSLGYFGGSFLSQTVYGYVGYKIAAYFLPRILEHYQVSLPSRVVHPLYRGREYVYQVGADGLNRLYNATPSPQDVMKVLTPPPPPE